MITIATSLAKELAGAVAVAAATAVATGLADYGPQRLFGCPICARCARCGHCDGDQKEGLDVPDGEKPE